MTGLPLELARLPNLRDLDLSQNLLPYPPVSVLSGLTSLTRVSMYLQQNRFNVPGLQVPSSLLPMLHPGLMYLSLQQQMETWDVMSMSHLGGAVAELAHRRPAPVFEF
jgi:hypothetical protein